MTTENAIRRYEGSQKRLEPNGTHQLLVYADDVNMRVYPKVSGLSRNEITTINTR
jgi:hypothetical protein